MYIRLSVGERRILPKTPSLLSAHGVRGTPRQLLAQVPFGINANASKEKTPRWGVFSM